MKKNSIVSSVLKYALSFVTVGVLLFSCANSEYSDFEKTASGLMYKFHVKSTDTVHANYGEVIRIKIAKRLGDSTLESSEMVNPDGLEQLLRKGTFSGGYEEGITLMAIGDSATFLISTDSINKYYPAKGSAKNFKPNSYLAFDIKLMNIQTQEEAMLEREQNRLAYVKDRKEAEPKELAQYIEDNHIEAKPNGKGLYFMETTKGKGIRPKDGDSVTIHFTGSFLNGTIFGSSLKRGEPIVFLVGDTTERGVFDGWYEGVKLMQKGSVATMVMPSSLAFDSLGEVDQQTGKYIIPPYTSLKFEVQLLDIVPKK